MTICSHAKDHDIERVADVLRCFRRNCPLPARQRQILIKRQKVAAAALFCSRCVATSRWFERGLSAAQTAHPQGVTATFSTNPVMNREFLEETLGGRATGHGLWTRFLWRQSLRSDVSRLACQISRQGCRICKGMKTCRHGDQASCQVLTSRSISAIDWLGPRFPQYSPAQAAL